ncbi:hypothetical protein HRED_04697, partial [Candidatus Haloredivivus sp. G17]
MKIERVQSPRDSGTSYATRHGQKGTVGMLVPERKHDLSQTKESTPDNHSLDSRHPKPYD